MAWPCRGRVFSARSGGRSTAELPSLVECFVKCFQMGGERGGVEGVQTLHVIEKLVELRLDLEAKVAVLVQRIYQSIQRECQAFGALPEDWSGRSPGGKFSIERGQGGEERSRAALVPVRYRGAPSQRIGLGLHVREIGYRRRVRRLADG